MVRVDFMKTYLKVIECGSLKKAAKALGMSVSTVSFQIKSLEEFYGVKLFKRDVNGIELTEEGKIVLKNVEYILGSIEETKRLILNLRNREISIASGMVGIDIIFSIKTLLKAKYPDLEVKVELKGAHECVKDVINGKVDFAIVGDLNDGAIRENDLFVTELGKDLLVLVVPVDHRLARKDTVTLEDVLSEQIIILNENYGITTSTMKALKKSGVNPDDLNIAYVVNDFFSTINAVSNGLGVAVTSFIAAWKACEVGLIKMRKIANFDGERTVYFIASRLAMESDKLREYADFVIRNSKKFFSSMEKRCKLLN